MMATTLFILAAVFTWLLLDGYSNQEIMARSYGFKIKIYRKNSKPILYWLTIWSYLIVIVICITVGTILVIKQL